MHTIAHRNVYGTIETNGLSNGPDYHRQEFGDCDWTTPGLKITRLRLVSDPGYPEWDVSYCHGMLDGKMMRVGLPFSSLPKRGMRGAIIEHARRDAVYAKGIGILDNISTLN